MKKHPTKKLKHKCGDHFHMYDIDVEIVPLISEMWKAEIGTCNSCQDTVMHEGYVWIDFETETDFSKFVSIVCDVGNDGIDLYPLIMYNNKECNQNEKTKQGFMIRYELCNYTDIFYDFSKDFEDDFKKARRPILNIRINVALFIRCDLLALVTNKIKQYNIKKEKGEYAMKLVCDGSDFNSSYIKCTQK